MANILLMTFFILFCVVGSGLAYLLVWDIQVHWRIWQEMKAANQLAKEPSQYIPYPRHWRRYDLDVTQPLPVGARRRAQLAELRRTQLVRVP